MSVTPKIATNEPGKYIVGKNSYSKTDPICTYYIVIYTIGFASL